MEIADRNCLCLLIRYPFSISDLHQQLAEIPQDKLVSLLHELIQDYRNFHGALEIHAFPDSDVSVTGET